MKEYWNERLQTKLKMTRLEEALKETIRGATKIKDTAAEAHGMVSSRRVAGLLLGETVR